MEQLRIFGSEINFKHTTERVVKRETIYVSGNLITEKFCCNEGEGTYGRKNMIVMK